MKRILLAIGQVWLCVFVLTACSTQSATSSPTNTRAINEGAGSVPATTEETALVPNPAEPSTAARDGDPMFPSGYPDEMTKYAIVTRPDAGRALYINPEALAALRDGQQLPDGTIITIIGHGDEAADTTSLHVAEKRTVSVWQSTDMPAGVAPDAWNFGAFDTQSRQRTDEDIQACFTCHRQFGDDERMFTQAMIQEFARSGQVQQGECNLPERTPCE